MKNKFKIIYTALLVVLMFGISYLSNAQSCADGSYQWSDMQALFAANNCANAGCHGTGAGGLNLTSYAGFSAGGNKCGTDITTGNTLTDIINVGGVSCGGGTIATPMNVFASGAIDATETAAIQAWIDAGAPEFCPAPPVCTDIVASAQPVCNGTAGTFDIQINSITGGDGLGDPSGTYTVSDGTTTITYPTTTSITGLAYTSHNDKVTLTITDDDDNTCSVSYDVLQLECLDQTVCDCTATDPFSINAQASANGDGYSMVYVLTDASGTAIALSSTGSFGPFPNDGATYNVYAYNVVDTDIMDMQTQLTVLLGQSISPSLTATQAAPFDAYCYIDMMASFTENCACCPEAVPLSYDIFVPFCEGDDVGATISDWQATVTSLNPLDATQDPDGIGSIVYSTVQEVDGVIPPNGMVASGVHSDPSTCAPETQVTYAYLACDNGTADAADDTYELISTLSYEIYPIPDVTNAAGGTCTGMPVDNCGGLTIEYSTDGGNTFSTTVPSLNPGDTDVTVDWQVSIPGSVNCAATGQYTLSCPLECPDIELMIGDQTICIEDATGYDLNTLSLMDGGSVWTDANGNTVSTVDIADGDTFTYTLTDMNDCTYTDMVTFTVNEGVDLIIDFIEVCAEDAIGYDLTQYQGPVTTGTWNVAGDPANIDLPTGGNLFIYTYLDDNGCESNVEVNIFVFDAIAFTIDDVTICEGETAILEPSGLDAAGTYTYLWNDGTTTLTLPVNFAGDYTLTVMDGNGCVGSATATVTVNTSPVISINDQQICPAAATGYDLTSLEPDGQTGGTWSTATPTSVDIADGDSFTYIYTDANGCTGSTIITFSINANPTIGIADQSICAEQATGYDLTSLEPTAQSGGTWSSATPANVDINDGDMFTYTYTDANGCTGTVTITFTINASSTIIIDDQSICFDVATGFDLTSLEPSGQMGGTWSTPTPTNVDIDLAGDSFTYTYTDANGCTGTADVFFTVIGLEVELPAMVTLCSDQAEGFDLTIFDEGADDVWYDQNDMLVADPTNVNITEGAFYTSNYTSFNTGCPGVQSLDFGIADEIQITAAPTCSSATEGEFFIDITEITGGIGEAGAYTVEAEGLSVDYFGTPVALGPFTYIDHNTPVTLTVTSDIGCTATYDVLQLNCADQEVCNCDGNPDTPYTINAQAAANGNGYSMVYALVNNDNGNMVQAINGTGIFPDLANNTNYTVYAFNVENADLAGFTAALNGLIMISEGDEVLMAMGAFANYCYESASAAFAEDCACLSCDDFEVIGVFTDLTCNGDGSGSIDLTVVGGQSPYNYAWSNGVATEDLSGLDAGTYMVTVNDASALDCEAILTFVISQPDAIGISNVDVTDATCSASDGSVVISVVNGVAPFTYGITELGISQIDNNTIAGIPAGDYTVTVTDANGCSASIPVTLAGTDAPSATIAVNQAPDCEESNGIIVVTPTGGTPPYTYAWDDAANQTTGVANNLPGGTYTVTVTDAAGCSTTESITLFPVGCPFNITNTFFASDACTCNNDQSDNGAGDGTFTETVTVTAPAGLIIRADVTSTGIEEPVNNELSTNVLPIEFYETFPGRYILIFNHIDRIGYTINVEYSDDGGVTFMPMPDGAGGQLSITNVCAYPVLAFNPPLEAAYCEDDGIVVIGVVETSDNVGFVPLQGFPSVQLNNGDQAPSPITFDPSTFGTATYTFSGFYDYENGPGTGGTLENPAVSLNPCATFIRVNVPVNPVPTSQATCEQTGTNEFMIDVDPMEDYQTPENLMYRIGDSGPYQMSDQFIVEEDGNYDMNIVDVVSACLYEVQTTCFRELPIELTAFEGACLDDEYTLTWTTATEENVSHFAVERSIDGQNYVQIAEVAAVGNSTVTQNYGYKDASGLSRQYYYRLRIVEFSGIETISRIESVSCLTGGFGVLDVYPNPTEDEVAVTFEVNSRDRLNISLVDVLGRTVNTQEFTPDIGLNRTVIDMSLLPSAMYYIVLEDGTQQSIEKVVKK